METVQRLQRRELNVVHTDLSCLFGKYGIRLFCCITPLPLFDPSGREEGSVEFQVASKIPLQQILPNLLKSLLVIVPNSNFEEIY